MISETDLMQCKIELIAMLEETEVTRGKKRIRKISKRIETMQYLVPALFLAVVFVSIVLR